MLVAVTCLTTGLAVGLAAGVLLGQARGPAGAGSAAPLGVWQAPTGGGRGGQVWSGRMRDGVPVGWAHSPAGAIWAATSYTMALSSTLLFDEAKRRLAVDAIAAPEAHARLQRVLDVMARTVAAALTRGLVDNGPAATLDPAKVILQVIPVRYRLDRYSDSSAQVSIWQTGVAGYKDSSLPAEEAWGVTRVSLRWADTDWKEVSAAVADGPRPTADDARPTPTRAFVGEARRFREYRYAPGP